jgi:hypothetical protein
VLFEMTQLRAQLGELTFFEQPDPFLKVLDLS